MCFTQLPERRLLLRSPHHLRRVQYADSAGDRGGYAGRISLEPRMSDSGGVAAAKSMASFRRRLDELFADPRISGFRADLRPPSALPASNTTDALNCSLAQTM